MRKIVAVILLPLLLLSLTVGAAALTDDRLDFVTDEAGLLTADELLRLQAQAQQASRDGCGVYIVTVEDYTDYTNSNSVYTCATQIYSDGSLGFGADDNGVLLLLSMEERDYAIIGYGSLGDAVVNGIDDDVFLDDFGRDDWYGGFEDYIAECADLIAGGAGQDGVKTDHAVDTDHYVTQPYRSGLSGKTLLLIVGGSCAVSGLICALLLSGMRTAKRKTGAEEYVPDRGVRMHITTDQFTHTTRSVRRVPRNNGGGGGGGSRSSGGRSFSGRSGKF